MDAVPARERDGTDRPRGLPPRPPHAGIRPLYRRHARPPVRRARRATRRPARVDAHPQEKDGSAADGMNGALRRVAVLGNHLPRQCGIATFTTDLSNALSAAAPDVDTFVLAMTDAGQ